MWVGMCTCLRGMEGWRMEQNKKGERAGEDGKTNTPTNNRQENGWTVKGPVHVPFWTGHGLSGLGYRLIASPFRASYCDGLEKRAGCVLARYACTLQGELQPGHPKLLVTRVLPHTTYSNSSSSKASPCVYPSRFDSMTWYCCICLPSSCHANVDANANASQHSTAHLAQPTCTRLHLQHLQPS